MDFTIYKTVAYVCNKHFGQKRRFSEEPYVCHPIRVALILSGIDQNKENIIKASLLHDVLEDTETTYKEICDLHGKIVADLVLELTSNKQQILIKGKVPYLINKMCGMSQEALLIKLVDRLDNVGTLIEIDKDSRKFAKWYRKETKKILEGLEEKRVLLEIHKQLIKEIKQYL